LPIAARRFRAITQHPTDKRQQGRPSGCSEGTRMREQRLSEKITTRFPAEVVDALAKVARRKFSSESEVIRQAVIAAVKREGLLGGEAA
jgi:hypothetical protein